MIISNANSILIIWTIYWVYSIAAAFITRIQVKRVRLGETFFDRLIQNTLMIIALYLIYIPQAGLLSKRMFSEYSWVYIVGLFIVIVSLFFADCSRRILAYNWSSAVQLVENQKLVTHGPYKFIRHPIYTGVTCAFFGTFLAQGTLASLIALVCMVVKYALKIKKEEHFLQALFGPQYALYKNKTWAMLPFFY